jgi:hypothetical protein
MVFMVKERKYTWYLEPIGSHTNRVISVCCDENGSHNDVVCKDGSRRNLWECSAHARDAIMASARSLNLKFRIFRREGNGKIENVTYVFRKIHAKRAKHT